jgi:hypothetical protein
MDHRTLAEAARAIANEPRVEYPEPTGEALAAIVEDARAGLGRRAIMVKHGIGLFHANRIVNEVRPRSPDLLSM